MESLAVDEFIPQQEVLECSADAESLGGVSYYYSFY